MIKRRFILISLITILSVVILSACGEAGEDNHAHQPSELQNARTVEVAAWELNADGGLDFDEGEFILSVSPSGNNILVAKVNPLANLLNRRPGNPLGREVEHISLYSKNENGRLVLTGRIYIDTSGGYSWNDIIAGGDETSVAWGRDENRLLLTGSKSDVRNFNQLMSGFSSVFLIDFNKQAVEDLTGGHFEPINLSDGGHSDHLPQWLDDYNISFVRYKLDSDESFVTSLMDMNLNTRNQNVLANLSVDGILSLVTDYSIHENRIYFVNTAGDFDKTGFLFAELNRGGNSPTLLLSFEELEMQPRTNTFTSVEVSSDGRWALLTILDQRVFTRDIPLADLPEYPQPDPGSAVSMMTRLPWIPYHNVILFDLHNGRIVDPFISSALRPTEVIVTAATFAPDGKALICTVFGDDEAWTMASFGELSLWQINIENSYFESMRMFRTEVEESIAITRVSWLDNDLLWIRPAWFYTPFLMPHILATPAALGWVNE
ncbi:MAG: hypothetical protein FWE21_02435 [Defluviitaleaceae bacterium]|nr:hypothetical protein [Defluviitaleaceae bacterium]